MAGFGDLQTERKTCEYQLHGPTKIQRIVAVANSPAPSLTCEVCKAEGPFGPNGPITDDPPEGLDSMWLFLVEEPNSKARGECPKCKQQTMKATGLWRT